MIPSRMPIFVKETYPSLNSTDVGIMIAASRFGVLISAPLVSKAASRVGRKNLIVWGMLLITTFLLCLISISYVNNPDWFIALTLFASLMQGVSEALT
jgi:MFS family permease